MLVSIALIFIMALALGKIFDLFRLPRLLGMMITGIILGPSVLNLIDGNILAVAADLRQIALVIILTRAGLALDIKDLKKVGRPAILMCFVPACVEMVGTVILAPLLLDVTYLEAAVMGSVLAAVSPAVIVPRMIKLMEKGYGKEHSVPQLLLAGASVDDVFVIVMFTAFTGLESGGSINVMSFLRIPISILLGVVMGALVGLAFVWFFKKFHMRDSVKLLLILSVSFLMIWVQNVADPYVPISGLLAIMAMGILMKQKYDVLADRLSQKYNKLWVAAEILLFVLVGAAVSLDNALTYGIAAIVLVVGALVFRMLGVFLCMIKTPLTGKERFFCMLAYTPKATVQAAIGAIPLSMGLACGDKVLTVAVLAILITAPFGAICVDKTYKKLLTKEKHVYEED